MGFDMRNCAHEVYDHFTGKYAGAQADAINADAGVESYIYLRVVLPLYLNSPLSAIRRGADATFFEVRRRSQASSFH